MELSPFLFRVRFVIVFPSVQDFVPVLDVTVAAQSHAPEFGVLRFENSGGVISDMVGVISAEDCFGLKPTHLLRHIACGSGSGDTDVDLCPVDEGPCKEGVDGSLDEVAVSH